MIKVHNITKEHNNEHEIADWSVQFTDIKKTMKRVGKDFSIEFEGVALNVAKIRAYGYAERVGIKSATVQIKKF